MTRLFDCEYQGHQIVLEGSSFSGLEQVLINGEVVSEHRNFGFSGEHDLMLEGVGPALLTFEIFNDHNLIRWELRGPSGQLATGEQAYTEALARTDMSQPPQAPRSNNRWIALGGAALKLTKSASAVKVALAGSAFAGWSLLFDWRFATMVISILVFHEYGHIRAMKRFGIPTKGIYLIPFFGGVAVGEQARTHWQEVYIAMMGPVFGLLMSFAALVAFWVTDIAVLGVVASFGALINLFNLLPIYPLDGGRVLKAVTFSASPRWSTWVLIALSAGGVALTASVGLYLLSFFLVFGAIDLFGTRAQILTSQVLPMDRYGMGVSFAWYTLVIAAFVIIIVVMAATGVPGTEVPLIILSD